MNYKSAMLTVAAIAMLSMPALAADTAPTTTKPKAVHMSPFEKLDANKDGALSKEEFLKNKKFDDKAFAKYDGDADGTVSMDEWKAQMPAKPAVATKPAAPAPVTGK